METPIYMVDVFEKTQVFPSGSQKILHSRGLNYNPFGPVKSHSVYQVTAVPLDAGERFCKQIGGKGKKINSNQNFILLFLTVFVEMDIKKRKKVIKNLILCFLLNFPACFCLAFCTFFFKSRQTSLRSFL